MSKNNVDEYGERFWRDFLSMSSFFSPAITPLQRVLNVESTTILYHLGEYFGRKLAEKIKSEDLESMITEVSRIWKEQGIGEMKLENTSPITIAIKNCAICGQIPEFGRMFKCAFHEGLIKEFLKQKTGKKIAIRQSGEYEGEGGTWSRRFIIEIL